MKSFSFYIFALLWLTCVSCNLGNDLNPFGDSPNQPVSGLGIYYLNISNTLDSEISLKVSSCNENILETLCDGQKTSSFELFPPCKSKTNGTLSAYFIEIIHDNSSLYQEGWDDQNVWLRVELDENDEITITVE